ncbi:MAG: 2-succinyl-5-enolpyruvyl-6-hydroxy-3-cyclohexene-1-carboxylic-acid synthase [Planctomycetota bacterium]|nr:2-succinyl-5-enolpyruvyl-6-hydroxy-3-cyclohexene-1-carboxylic-acid synthase [Planctomycetota bacterium]MDA1106245.1 2-succinyl-5-enolpyruvyl-6-hydroxy-3-cyclohexene-1-carboxylic-acid synthase [Planctomycetota bacterium]
MIDAPNINLACAGLLIEEFSRCGGRIIFATPGSRSAPLVVAAARHGAVALHMCIDERTASFAALGASRATGVPAAVITTSGTAVANCLPACVEAHQSGVPLLVLTADRPAALQECGANQTIRQESMLASQARWHFTLPVPADGVDGRVWLSVMDQAWGHATGARPGPVHLNCPFAEPLDPVKAPGSLAAECDLSRWHSGSEPWRRWHAPHLGLRDAGALEATLRKARHGVIVAGSIDHPEDAYHARTLAQRAPWPIIADVASGLRSPVSLPRTLRHGTLLLRAAAGRPSIRLPRPDVVLRIGGACAWRHVDEWCAQAQCLVVAGVGARMDPHHAAAEHAAVSLAELAALEAWKDCEPCESANEWERADQSADAILRRDGTLAEDAPAIEPDIAAAVFASAREGSILVLGSSMPVRDMDAFGGASARSLQCVANRGASGIDGLIATASGASLSTGAHVIAILGDLSAMHDLSSLELLRRTAVPVLVIVVNNNGGGIFQALPISKHADVFERAFVTPHGLGFKSMAAAFGLGYRRATTAGELRLALREGASSTRLRRSSIVEVVVDRAGSVAARTALLERVAEALSAGS